MPMLKRKPGRKRCKHCRNWFEFGGRGRPRASQEFCSKRCTALSRVVHAALGTLSLPARDYIAGLMDGEGSIVLWDRGYGGRPQLRVTISNTHEGLMQYLLRTTKVGTVVRHEHPPETGYKCSLTWQIYGQNAVALLQQLLPRLIVKRARAIEAIKSQEF